MNRMMLVLLLLGSGCSRHVALTAPPKTAPIEERRQAYNDLELQPIGYSVSTSSDGKSRVSQIWMLGDETRIRHIPDLGQVVDPDSETAGHIDAYLHAHEPYTYLKWVALGLLVGGTGLAYYGISDESIIPGVVGGVSMLSSGVVFLSYKLVSAVDRAVHLEKVSGSYNDDLRTHLGLQLAAEFRQRQRLLEAGEAAGFRDTSGDPE